MKTQRMIKDFASDEERQAAIDENKRAVFRMLEAENKGPHKGNFSHEVGRIKRLRAGMTGMVTTVWEAE